MFLFKIDLKIVCLLRGLPFVRTYILYDMHTARRQESNDFRFTDQFSIKTTLYMKSK